MAPPFSLMALGGFTDSEQHTLSGWQRFFGGLSGFIREDNRQTGSSNANFTEYVVDRLEMFSVSVSTHTHTGGEVDICVSI